jgi:hypothetical protein
MTNHVVFQFPRLTAYDQYARDFSNIMLTYQRLVKVQPFRKFIEVNYGSLKPITLPHISFVSSLIQLHVYKGMSKGFTG